MDSKTQTIYPIITKLDDFSGKPRYQITSCIGCLQMVIRMYRAFIEVGVDLDEPDSEMILENLEKIKTLYELQIVKLEKIEEASEDVYLSLEQTLIFEQSIRLIQYRARKNLTSLLGPYRAGLLPYLFIDVGLRKD